MNERVQQAAIKKGKRIWTGRRHSDCFQAMIKDGVLPSSRSKEVQGFMTEGGQFVDRKEAYKIAVECGQIKDDSRTKILISEDLY